MLLALASLMIGVVIGYLGQKYYLCFISPIITLYMRIKYKVRTTLADYDAFLGVMTGAAMAFLILLAISGETVALSAGAISVGDVARSIVGGFALGYISVKVNGCPFRKHVEAGEGEIESMLFIVGYYCGIMYYSLVLSEIVSYLLG